MDDDSPTPVEIGSVGRALLRRTLDPARSVIVSTADFAPLIEAWRLHAAIWQDRPDDFSDMLMRQGLAAASLHLANRPRDEIAAWTINVRFPPTNVFLTGEARSGIVTGRAFTDGVRTHETSRFYIETLRARGEPFRSAIEIEGVDVLGFFEQYYERSEQLPARFFELGEERFCMVLAMPGADRSWFAAMTAEEAVRAEEEGNLIEERSFRFECGCTPRKMRRALLSIYEGKLEELFQEDSSVEVHCPRCGRHWRISREQLSGAGPPGGVTPDP
jgi:molecular chaperone Hsp33